MIAPRVPASLRKLQTLNATTAIFVNYAANDFRLAAPMAGRTLAAPYATDALGKTRGADGVFDRGAYEFEG